MRFEEKQKDRQIDKDIQYACGAWEHPMKAVTSSDDRKIDVTRQYKRR